MSSLRPVYVVDAVRTPIARYGGGLAEVRPDDLAAHVLARVLDRAPALREQLGSVVFGATNQAGEDNRNVARMAVLLAGLPYEVPAVTVNRLCGSGLEAVNQAAMAIATGDADVVVAGGVESMTRAPFSMPKASGAFDRTPPPVYDTTIGWRYPNAKMAARFALESMGETAENVAVKYGIAREAQDAFALESQRRAVAAWEARAFDAEIVPVPLPAKKGQEPAPFAKDESPRGDTTMEKLAKLGAAFRKGGTVTAGNSSPVNDGAAAVLLASEEAVQKAGLRPLGRVVAQAVVGVEPNFMGEGPIPATRKALARAGWRVADLDAIELNEAFAAQALACVRTLELDPAKVNPTGGAIALGHPIGASGARLVATLLHGMRARGQKRGLASLCIGVGQGIATLFEAT
jgi:3-oxoadipyl-CoA thiolase